jgi:uncharacterized membrane protein
MRRWAVEAIVLAALFAALAFWNGAIATFFGIAALAWLLGRIYWRTSGMLDDDPRRR